VALAGFISLVQRFTLGPVHGLRGILCCGLNLAALNELTLSVVALLCGEMAAFPRSSRPSWLDRLS
jgi:hypothetical protein